MVAWSCLKRECESDGEILRPIAIVNQPERQGARPTAQVTVERVKLLLQAAILRIERVRGAQAPVVVHQEKHCARDEIVATAQKSAVQIPVADAPTPPFVWCECELVGRHVQLAIVNVVAQPGIERNPCTRAEREVGIKVIERLLTGLRPEPPVQHDVPIDQIIELTVAFGLKCVAQAEANHVLAVNGVNVIVVGKLPPFFRSGNPINW